MRTGQNRQRKDKPNNIIGCSTPKNINGTLILCYVPLLILFNLFPEIALGWRARGRLMGLKSTLVFLVGAGWHLLTDKT